MVGFSAAATIFLPVSDLLAALPAHKQLEHGLLPAEALHLRVPDVRVPQIKNLNVVETKSRCKGGVRKAFSNPMISNLMALAMRLWLDEGMMAMVVMATYGILGA